MIRISVVTIALNAARTLPAALRSVASQDWPQVEHWLIDGGSRDDTAEVVARYGSHLAGFVSEPDCGLYDALNKGLARCTGDVIGFLHADDCYAGPDVLSAVARAFEAPGVDAAYGDLEYVSRRDPERVIRYWRAGPFDRRALAWGWMPPHPTLFLRRSVYDRVGGFDTSYRIAADYDHILRVFSDPTLHAVYLPRVLVRMQVGGISNRSLGNVARKSVEDLRALRQHHVGGIAALVCKNLRKVDGFFRRAPLPA